MLKRTGGILGLVVLVAGCDGHTSLRGKVVGTDEKPVAGAKVRLFEPERAERDSASTTDEAGQYSVGLIHPPFDVPLAVTVTKEGYKPYRKDFKARERENFPVKIVLEPDR